MQAEYEYLIEHRAVVERAKQVIFGRKEPKTGAEELLSGETDAIA
jgi:hypothetical protein